MSGRFVVFKIHDTSRPFYVTVLTNKITGQLQHSDLHRVVFHLRILRSDPASIFSLTKKTSAYPTVPEGAIVRDVELFFLQERINEIESTCG